MSNRFRIGILWAIAFSLICTSILMLDTREVASASTNGRALLQRATPTKTRKLTATPTPIMTPVPLFQMGVDALICVRGHGPVALGTVQQGSIKSGESVVFDHPGVSDSSVVVNGIQTFWGTKSAVAGQTIGVLLRLPPSAVETKDLSEENYRLVGISKRRTAPTSSLADEPFQMSVSAVRNVKGKGTIIRGLIDSGAVEPEQEVEILRSAQKPPITAIVTEIENLTHPQTGATVCDRVALHLQGVSAGDLQDARVVQQDNSLLPFQLTVIDVFSIKGRGTVVTGRVKHDTLRPGQQVVIRQDGEPDRRVVVTAIEKFRKIVDEASPGDNVGLLLRGVEKDDISRGALIEGVTN